MEQLALIALLLIALAASLSAAPVKAPFDGIPEINLQFGLGSEAPEWSLKSRKADSAQYLWEGYVLKLKLEPRGAQKLLHVELTPPKGEKLSVTSYSAEVRLPQSNAHAVMVPNQNKIARLLDYWGEHHSWPENFPLYRNLLTEGFTQAAPTNAEAPFILLTDDRGGNRLAVGWSAAERGTALEGRPDAGSYVLSLRRAEDLPFAGDSLKDALVIDTGFRPWIEAEQDYAKTFDRYNAFKHRRVPEWATDPVYCTWYCYGDKITQDGVLKIARKCKELGFGTVLIDAGWDCNTGGGYIDWQTGILGDYIARPDRFPDMPGLVKQIHEMGLRVMLWCAPFWEGKKSIAYREKTSTWHMYDDEGQIHELCPRHPEVRKHFFDSFAWIAKTYDIDGMWIDAADAVRGRCMADHPHLDEAMGPAFVDCIAACGEGLRSVKPDAVTEARVMHGNINTKRAFDMIQPSDAPQSYEILRLAGIHIRPWTYDMVVKNDPMYWNKKADAATVGKFLATMVTNGIPALSVDYLTASEEHCRITKAWLSFYHEHKETLHKGKFSLFGADFGSPDMMLVGRDEAVIYLKNPKTTEVRLPRPVKRVILLNCTNSDDVKLTITPAPRKMRLTAYSQDWSQVGEPVNLAGGPIAARIPQGGAAVIQ